MKHKIRKLYDAIFDVAFADKLEKQPKLSIWPVGSDYGYYLDGVIDLVVLQHLHDDYVWGAIADTLAHELTHAYQDQLGVLHESSDKKQHDKFFKQEFRNAMAKLYEEWK